MMDFLRSPLTRMSFGLVLITTSALLVSDLFGIMPNPEKTELDARKIVAEALAVQVASAINSNQPNLVEKTLQQVADRNPEVMSAGIRNSQGRLMVDTGSHAEIWTLEPGDRSTPTQAQVPLFLGEQRWGNLELAFTRMGGLYSLRESLIAVILSVAAAGFLGYLLFLKRSLRELDPKAVIPERVRRAFDTLSEGLIIVDRDGIMVFSNQAFAVRVGQAADALVGRASSSLAWRSAEGNEPLSELPWKHVLEGGDLAANTAIQLLTESEKLYKFSMHATAISQEKGPIRGALITFDDLTEIEEKNRKLQGAIDDLELSQRKVKDQNRQLTVLATRDSLTNVLNRRSLFQNFEALMEEALKEGRCLSCIMVDIDHFKSVNDKYGHAIGDNVIKYMAETLTRFSRSADLVGRYGGEEFCLVLPEIDRTAASAIAERIRRAVEKGQGANRVDAIDITASFGVADLASGASQATELMQQADHALYKAKQSGRNRVVLYDVAFVAEAG